MKAGLICVLWAGFAAAPSTARTPHAELRALMDNPVFTEISGLTASPRFSDTFWVHNDGDEGRLYAIDQNGKLLSRLDVADARALDWEDIATIVLDGKPMLIIADTGDNGGLRTELSLVAIEEPTILAPHSTASVAWRLRFRWPDGARDCEALAIDPSHRNALLITKKRWPPEVFRLPLDAPRNRINIAKRIGTLAGILPPSEQDLQQNPMYGRYRSQVTAADISPDGARLVVLTYRHAVLYVRRPGDSWRETVSQVPRELPFPWLPQAEALGFRRNGQSVLISSERLPAPLIEIFLP